MSEVIKINELRNLFEELLELRSSIILKRQRLVNQVSRDSFEGMTTTIKLIDELLTQVQSNVFQEITTDTADVSSRIRDAVRKSKSRIASAEDKISTLNTTVGIFNLVDQLLFSIQKNQPAKISKILDELDQLVDNGETPLGLDEEPPQPPPAFTPPPAAPIPMPLPSPPSVGMDRSIFYDSVRNESTLFKGSLSQGQVSGMDAILDFWEKPPVEPTGEFKVNWDIRCIEWLAYMLATTFHETAFTMQPITEYGQRPYFSQYDNRSDLGNGPAPDGFNFRGRGYVQITGRRNYEVMTPIVRAFYPNSPSFLVDPEAVKKPEYAAIILFYGMFVGTFTGYALKHHIGDPNRGQKVDYINARRGINGIDKSHQIAGYAEKFEKALKKAGARA